MDECWTGNLWYRQDTWPDVVVSSGPWWLVVVVLVLVLLLQNWCLAWCKPATAVCRPICGTADVPVGQVVARLRCFLFLLLFLWLLLGCICCVDSSPPGCCSCSRSQDWCRNDLRGWWSFVPEMRWYFLVMLLLLVWVASSPESSWRCCRSLPSRRQREDRQRRPWCMLVLRDVCRRWVQTWVWCSPILAESLLDDPAKPLAMTVGHTLLSSISKGCFC